MTGIQYITNYKGQKTDLVISLKEHGQTIKDVLDMLMQEDNNEDRVWLEELRRQLEENGRESTKKRPLKFGMMKGTFRMSDDFDAPLDDLKDY